MVTRSATIVISLSIDLSICGVLPPTQIHEIPTIPPSGTACYPHGHGLTILDNILFETRVEYSNGGGQHLQMNIARPKNASDLRDPWPHGFDVDHARFGHGCFRVASKACAEMPYKFPYAGISFRLAHASGRFPVVLARGIQQPELVSNSFAVRQPVDLPLNRFQRMSSCQVTGALPLDPTSTSNRSPFAASAAEGSAAFATPATSRCCLRVSFQYRSEF